MSDKGMTTIEKAHNVKGTIDLVEADVKSKRMAVFACIDHAGAKEVGLMLRRTPLPIFASAKAGTPLMQSNQ